MSFDHYLGILSSNLFLQTPLVEEEASGIEDGEDKDVHDSIIETIEQLTSGSIDHKKEYRSLIITANKARDLIIGADKIEDSNHLQYILKLWNVRLTLLVLSNELSIAQQESKRLSMALSKAFRLKHSELDKSSKIPNANSVFGDEVSLGLRILIIRLKSIGPNTALSTEYYLILWQLRQQFLDQEDKRDDLQLKIEILAYSIASNLIAKREYSTFLTQAESIVDTLESAKDDEINKQQQGYKDRISFLAILVSLIKGDWDLATLYFQKISDPESFKTIVSSLEHILKNVDPVLDLKRLGTDTSARESTNLEHVTTLDDLFELIKEQRITGRILCSLCALFELQLRQSHDNSGNDLFENFGSNDGLTAELLKLWLQNTNKLYGFE